MGRHCFLYLCLSLASLLTMAETIELWRGEPITDATMKRIHEGRLYYEADGVQNSVRLVEVKSMYDATAESAPKAAKVLAFRDMTWQNKAGKLLMVVVQTSEDRIHEPLVRLYVMQEDDRGRRSVTLYQNHRNTRDPSRLEDVPTIAAATYARKLFFAETTDPIGLRLEIWLEGDLAFATNNSQTELPANWWRSTTELRRMQLAEISREELEAKAAAAAAEIEANAPPPITCTITRAMTSTKLGGDVNAEFVLAYTVASDKLAALPLPQATLHMVLQTRDNRRLIQSIDMEKDAGQEIALVHGRAILRETRHEFPADVTLNSANMRLNKEIESALVAWRVELKYDDHTMAVKQGGEQRVLETLPENWYK